MRRLKNRSELVDDALLKLLNEGFYKSFPAHLVKVEVEKALSNIDFSIREPDDFDRDELNDLQVLTLSVKSKDASKIPQLLRRVMTQCGWYIGEEASEDGVLQFSLEPRYPIVNSRVETFSITQIKKIRVFYHVTFEKYARKILRDGLQPSFTQRNEFHHPLRVYLFGERELAERFLDSQLMDFDLQLKMGTRKIGNTGKEADIRFQDNPVGMRLFSVDLFSKLKNGSLTRLYHDNRWDAGSAVFFTQDSINPEYLKEVL